MDEPSPHAEDEIEPPFRWSPKVGAILILTGIMLVVPFTLMSFVVIDMGKSKAAPVQEEPAPKELQESLERAAEVMKPTELGSEQRIVVIGTDYVKKVSADFGTASFESGEGRYWVRLPKEQRAAFTRALASGEKPLEIPQAISPPELLEVVIQPLPPTP